MKFNVLIIITLPLTNILQINIIITLTRIIWYPSVFKTLCGNLSQHLPPEPFAIPTHNYYEALGYTAATKHYIDPEASKHCTIIIKAHGPDVIVANGGIITPSLQAKVTLSKELSNKAQYVFILDDLKTGYPLSIGQLCDDDCIAIFRKFNFNILKNNRIIITGTRNDHGMWSILLQSPTSPTPEVPR